MITITDIAHIIYDVFRDIKSDRNKAKSEDQLKKLLFEIKRAKQKTDMWIKINTILLTLILAGNILIICSS